MNTPDTFVNETLDRLFTEYEVEVIDEYEVLKIPRRDLRTTLQDVITSRDTYWKERVDAKDDLLDDMWGLICNVNGGIVENERPEWYEAFQRIREKYFKQITPITNEDKK